MVAVLVVLIALNPGGVFTEQRPKVELSESKKQEIEQEVRERVRRSNEAEMYVKAKKAVLSQLKDPASAEFRNLKYGDSEETGPAVYGYVNSKNSFGGYTGFQRFISNGKTTLFEEEKSRLDEAWNSLEPKP